MGKILLFYKYVGIDKPTDILSWQQELGKQLNLKGRVFIADEGINGTLGGTVDEIDCYKHAMLQHPLFFDIDFKEGEGSANHFPSLKIKIKKEIVRLGIDPKILSAQDAADALTPIEAHALIQSNSPDLIVLDTRNDYESCVGTFEKAVIPNTKTFREFPQYIDNNIELFKDKNVLLFCTGGVRCERASAYLKLKNVAKNIYHIRGGIHNYVKEFPNGYFKGKNYVFDGRISTKVTDDILAQCHYCFAPYDDYTNCINAACNRHIIVCPGCITKHHNTCSDACLELVQSCKVPIRTIPCKIDM
jgi:predicted sulfurtransferase